MNMDPYEVIGAFVDGERVDPDALKAALSTDEGRQYLIDVAALREMTIADGSQGLTAGAATTPKAAVLTPPARRWTATLAAAAAVVVALAGGYAAGRHAAPAGSSDRQALANQPAPAPTSVIRLEPGVDWHEQTPRN